MNYESKYSDDEPLTFDDLKPGDFSVNLKQLSEIMIHRILK